MDEEILPSASATSGYSHAVGRRYRDAYRVANGMNFWGGFVKFLGFLTGLALAGGNYALSEYLTQHRQAVNQLPSEALNQDAILYLFLSGFAVAFVIWLMLFIAGTRICAQAQAIRANIDTAVNTSPFVNDAQKAQIMSLYERIEQ